MKGVLDSTALALAMRPRRTCFDPPSLRTIVLVLLLAAGAAALLLLGEAGT